MLVAERSDLFLLKKVKEWFWSCVFLLIYASFLVISTLPCHKRRNFPFSVLVTWHFHKRNVFTFLVGLYKKWLNLVFQIHLFKKRRNSQMAAVMLQLTSRLCTLFSKTASLFLQTLMKQILWVKNTVLFATTTRCASYPIADITLF